MTIFVKKSFAITTASLICRKRQNYGCMGVEGCKDRIIGENIIREPR